MTVDMMRGAEDQERLEEKREASPPFVPVVVGDDASQQDKLKATLSNILKKDEKNPEDKRDLNVLMKLFEKDKNPLDDIFNGQNGDYKISDGFVSGAGLFKEGTKNDSPENIKGVLELAQVAKATFGDDKVYCYGPENEEQNAMNKYAAHLAGVNLGGDNDFSKLSPDIKGKMDKEWAVMNGNAPAAAPTFTADPAVSQEQKFAAPKL